MKRLLLVVLLCSLSPPALGLVRTVGTGRDYTVMATAFAALVSGDTVESYGPYTETNQTLAPPAGIVNVIWRHYGADYVFDGTAATSVFLTLAATNTGWDVNVRSTTGRVKVTGYIGAQPFVVSGASNVIAGFWLTANGAIGVYQQTLVVNADFNEIGDILIDYPVDAAGVSWIGVYLLSGAGVVVRDVTIKNVTRTLAGSTYGVISATAALVASPLIERLTVRDVSCGAAFYGAYLPGVNGYATIVDSSVYGITAGGIINGFYLSNRSASLVNLHVYGTSSPTTEKAIGFAGTQVGMPTDSNVDNCTVVGGEYGIFMADAPVGGDRFVSNCISHGAATSELSTVAGGVTGSTNNWATNNRYSVDWPVSATDLSGDPVFVDSVNNNYRLRWQPGVESPCIDSGTPVPFRVMDLDGQPISGPAQDRGCFEFQQVGSHDARTPLTAPVLTTTRNFRSTR